MKRKFYFCIMIMVISVLFVACGGESKLVTKDGIDKEHTKTQEIEEESNEQIVKEELQYSQSLTFMGYKFGYPTEVNMSDSDYGHTFRYNSEIAVLIEAPSVAGILLDVQELEDAATICKEYIVETFEDTVRELFDFDATEQYIEKSEVITINGIDMLRVKGTFSNVVKGSKTVFCGYYFLCETYPIYIVGVPIEEKADVEAFIDNLAGAITK